MTFVGLAARNLRRNKFRVIMTMAGIAVAMLAFVAIRTVLDSWSSAKDSAAKDRIATRHKVTFVMELPRRYAEDIAKLPEVKAVSWANWFGAKDPNHEHEFFANIAVDPTHFLEVYDEIQVTPAEKASWLEDRRGALVGDVLARKMGWKVGDKVTLEGTIFPGNWEFDISGVYTTTRRSVDRSSFFFHWEYLNEGRRPEGKDRIGWIVSKIDDPAHAADLSKKIDQLFDDRDIQTVTMSEKALQQSFMGMFAAVLKALNWVSLVILVIMTLILGNTIAMGVRERTNEYGMMRAVGFRPGHIATLVVGEGIVLGVLGGLLGLGLAYPLIEKGLGRFLEENVGGMFPYFRISGTTAILVLLASAIISVVAGLIPAVRAARLNVVDAIRRVG